MSLDWGDIEDKKGFGDEAGFAKYIRFGDLWVEWCIEYRVCIGTLGVDEISSFSYKWS